MTGSLRSSVGRRDTCEPASPSRPSHSASWTRRHRANSPRGPCGIAGVRSHSRPMQGVPVQIVARLQARAFRPWGGMEPSTGGFITTQPGLRAWVHGDTAGGSACTSIPSHARMHALPLSQRPLQWEEERRSWTAGGTRRMTGGQQLAERAEVLGPANRAHRRNGTEPRERRGQRGPSGARQVGSRHDDEDRVPV